MPRKVSNARVAEAWWHVRRVADDVLQTVGVEVGQKLRREDHAPRDISQESIAEVFASYKEMLLKWRSVPVGGTLHLLWPN